MFLSWCLLPSLVSDGVITGLVIKMPGLSLITIGTMWVLQLRDNANPPRTG